MGGRFFSGIRWKRWGGLNFRAGNCHRVILSNRGCSNLGPRFCLHPSASFGRCLRCHRVRIQIINIPFFTPTFQLSIDCTRFTFDRHRRSARHHRGHTDIRSQPRRRSHHTERPIEQRPYSLLFPLTVHSLRHRPGTTPSDGFPGNH